MIKLVLTLFISLMLTSCAENQVQYSTDRKPGIPACVWNENCTGAVASAWQGYEVDKMYQSNERYTQSHN